MLPVVHELPRARVRSLPNPDTNTGEERRKHTRRLGLTSEISFGFVAMALAVDCALVMRSYLFR